MQILFKSIVLQLNDSGQLAVSSPRKKRLHEKTKDIRQLLYALAMTAKHRSRNAPLAARDIVRSVAVFISELICILDRGLVSLPLFPPLSHNPCPSNINLILPIYSSIFNA